jgi:hypothetical protein
VRNLFIVFSLAVAAGAGYLLYLDFHHHSPPSQSAPPPQNKENIGVVQTSRNNTLAIGAPVFSKDTVKTGDDSDVALKMTNGTLIQVKSDSEVYLEKTGPGASITMKTGELNIENTTSAIQFTTLGAIVVAEGASLSMATATNGKSTITSQKGQVKIFDKNSKTATLTENEMAELNNGVLVNIHGTAPLLPKASTVKVQTPLPVHPTPASTPFTKKTVVKSAPIKVETKKSPTPAPTPLPTLTPTPTPSNEKNTTFAIVSPKDQTELTRDLTLDHPGAILFQWQVTKPLPGPLVLTVSHDPQFSDPIVINNIKKTSASVVLKKEGVYYWNLSSQSADGSDLEISPAITFDLKSAGALTAPSPLAPKNAELIESDEAKAITFKWKAGKNVSEYHIVVKRTDPATKEQFIEVDQVLHEVTFTSDPLELGAYSWMVTAKDLKNREKGFSREITFRIDAPVQMAPPKLKEPVVK